MKTRSEAVDYCLTYKNVYQDHPFSDQNWCVIRHTENRKVFAWIFEKEGFIWINVKCDSQWRQLWRDTYPAVRPAYHLNKEHWNSLILDGTIPRKEIERMITESYELTLVKRH